MNKAIIIMLICVGCIIVSITLTYMSYKGDIQEVKKFNVQYEQYYDKTLLGSDIATLINKAVDNNEKNEVEKDSKRYIYR